MKFLFANCYSFYLNETPTQSLFKETSKAFHHGCIRQPEPEKNQPATLVRNDLTWDNGIITAAMERGIEKNSET